MKKAAGKAAARPAKPKARLPAKAKPIFFASAAEFAAWLEANHDKAQEVWVGYHRVHTGRPSMTWSESVDEALCVGWIDGVRYGIDGDSYMMRFTPRRPGSRWSAVNVKKVAALQAQGRMRAAGLAAFAARGEKNAAGYSYQQRSAVLSPELEKVFRAARQAWAFFEAQPPGYKRTLVYWVMSAKADETRRRRLDRLIEASASGRRLQ